LMAIAAADLANGLGTWDSDHNSVDNGMDLALQMVKFSSSSRSIVVMKRVMIMMMR
jgi:hypothetical protein